MKLTKKQLKMASKILCGHLILGSCYPESIDGVSDEDMEAISTENRIIARKIMLKTAECLPPINKSDNLSIFLKSNIADL